MTHAPAGHTVKIHPLTPERWAGLETLFGPWGATGGCWCMWWRMPRAEFKRLAGEGNRLAFFAFTGLSAAFARAGFVEVTRRSEKRPIMRWQVEDGRAEAPTEGR